MAINYPQRYDDDFLNTVKTVIDHVNVHGKTIQDLVAEGQLTEEQYAELIAVINGLIKSGHVDKSDLTPEFKGEIEGFSAQLNNKRDKSDLISLNDADSEFVSAITGGATVNITSIPKDYSVHPEKTTFIKTSTNLIDESKLLKHHVMRADTNYEPAENLLHHVTDYISVNPGEKITLHTHNIGHRIVYYDSSRNYVSDDYQDGHIATFEIPQGIYFFRTNIQVSLDGKPQINRGGTLLPYTEYEPPVLDGVGIGKLNEGIVDSFSIADGAVGFEQTSFIETSTNLFVKENTISNKTIDATNGNLVDNLRNDTLEYVDVSGSDVVAFVYIGRVGWYDADKKFIESTAYEVSETTIVNRPETAKYISLVVHHDDLDNAQFNLGSELLPYEKGHKPRLSEDIELKIEGGTAEGNKEVKDNFIFDVSLEGTFDDDRTHPDYTHFETIQSHEVYAMFDELQQQHPEFITKQPLSDAPSGLEISAYKTNVKRAPSDEESRLPKVFITTGTHGYERGSALAVYLLLKGMCEESDTNRFFEALRYNVEFIFIPVTNPWGWNRRVRKNENEIDINRNFPEDHSPGTPESSTYGGEEPLSEIESQNIKRIFDENPEIDIFYDFHNFNGTSETRHFIWWPNAGGKWNEQMGDALIKKLSRKWQKDFDFIPEGEMMGYTQHMKQGTIHNYANSIGISINGTFETSTRFWLDENSVRHDANAVKGYTETLVNLLLINMRELMK